VSPEELSRVKGVLAEALMLPGDARIPRIQDAFPDEPKLWDELLAILDGYGNAARVNPGWTSGTTFDDLVPAVVHVAAAAPPTSITSSVLNVGAKYGPYRVVRILEPGGMGEVAVAEDTRLPRQVVLKCLAGKWLASPLARQRLMREARTAAALSHPNIATLYDVLEDYEQPLLVMEYVQGRTLRDILYDGPVSLGLAMRYAIQITEAVGYAHDHGIVHCDIKPANVQVTSGHVAKVLDFGLARVMLDPLDELTASEAGKVMGTAGYMAPERLTRGTLNTAGDIYAIGVVLFELLTNRPPYTALGADLMLAVLATDAPKPSSIVPGLPAQLDAIVSRALARDPELRYRSALELSRDLAESLASIEGRAWSGQFPLVAAPAPGPDWRRLALWGIAAAVGVTLAGFVTSTIYNSPLGIREGFESESPLSWPVWGLKALVAPMVYMTAVSVAIILLIFVGRLLLNAGPLRRVCSRGLAKLDRLMNQIAALPIATLAPALLFVQIVALAVLFWQFQALFQGLDSFISQRSPANFAALGPGNRAQQKLFDETLWSLVLASGVAWFGVLQIRRQRNDRDATALIVGGVMLTVLSLFVGQVIPFRIIHHNEAERVTFESRRCHLVGQRASEALLFCPLQPPPWNQIVKLDDAALNRERVFENIFAEFGENEVRP
jgi:tRNA A-37 threonylcarbamoyl transferase component Bud32